MKRAIAIIIFALYAMLLSGLFADPAKTIGPGIYGSNGTLWATGQIYSGAVRDTNGNVGGGTLLGGGGSGYSNTVINGVSHTNQASFHFRNTFTVTTQGGSNIIDGAISGIGTVTNTAVSGGLLTLSGSSTIFPTFGLTFDTLTNAGLFATSLAGSAAYSNQDAFASAALGTSLVNATNALASRVAGIEGETNVWNMGLTNLIEGSGISILGSGKQRTISADWNSVTSNGAPFSVLSGRASLNQLPVGIVTNPQTVVAGIGLSSTFTTNAEGTIITNTLSNTGVLVEVDPVWAAASNLYRLASTFGALASSNSLWFSSVLGTNSFAQLPTGVATQIVGGTSFSYTDGVQTIPTNGSIGTLTNVVSGDTNFLRAVVSGATATLTLSNALLSGQTLSNVVWQFDANGQPTNATIGTTPLYADANLNWTNLNQFSSGNATAGFLATANGSGGILWSNPPAGGSSFGGTGVANQVSFFSSSSSVTGDSRFVWNPSAAGGGLLSVGTNTAAVVSTSTSLWIRGNVIIQPSDYAGSTLGVKIMAGGGSVSLFEYDRQTAVTFVRDPAGAFRFFLGTGVYVAQISSSTVLDFGNKLLVDSSGNTTLNWTTRAMSFGWSIPSNTAVTAKASTNFLPNTWVTNRVQRSSYSFDAVLDATAGAAELQVHLAGTGYTNVFQSAVPTLGGIDKRTVTIPDWDPSERLLITNIANATITNGNWRLK